MAESIEADLYVCPELCLSGYHARDLFVREEFLREEARQLEILREWTAKSRKAIWVGHTLRTDERSGPALYNAASLFADGVLLQRVRKRQLPNYNIFEERRYFRAATEVPAKLNFRNVEMHTEICEDSWQSVQTFGLDETFHYPTRASSTTPGQIPQVLVNLSASPFESGKAQVRRDLLSGLARESHSFVVYVNYAGAQDELIFDGQSSVYAPSGEVIFEAPAFSEGVFVVDLTEAPCAPAARNRWADFHAATVSFIRDYARKTGFQKVVLGLSGGIDSALCAALCADALGSDNVLGVGLATRWTSRLSIDEAEILARNLGIGYRALNIETGLDSVTDLIGEDLAPLSQENIQSRLRGLVLMTLANNQNRLLISTANKSEIAMGYSTLYGDMCGALMPIGDLYKTEVYGLAHYLNQVAGRERIPTLTLSRAPSAELSPDQKDSDSLPEYPKLDAFLYMYLEHRERFVAERERWDKFLAPYSCASLVRKMQLNEFKRIQAPLIARLHHRSFGKHWCQPVAKAIDLPGPAS